MVSYRWIGKRGAHLSDREVLDGRARFPADEMPEDCLWVAFARAKRAPARVAAVDVSAARAMPGVLDVCGAADLASPVRFGFQDQNRPLFVDGPVGFAGEPVAMVIADKAAVALEAAESIRIDLEPGQSPWAARQAPAAEAESRYGDLQAGWKKAFRTFERRWSLSLPALQSLAATPAVVWPDGRGGLEILGRSRWVKRDAGLLARALGLDADQVRFVSDRVEGPWPTDEDLGDIMRLGLACLRRRAPVRLVSRTRPSPGLRQVSLLVRAGVNRAGRLLACALDLELDAGAYPDGAQAFLDACLEHLPGPYRMDSLELRGRALCSHSGAYGDAHAWDAALVSTAFERHLDWMAGQQGRDPLAWRQSLALRPGDQDARGRPVARPFGAIAVIRAARKSAGWRHRQSVRKEQTPHVFRGIGLGLAQQPCGSSVAVASLDMKLQADGCVKLHSGRAHLGLGMHQVLRRAAAERFALDPEAVQIESADSRSPGDAGPALSASSSWRLLSALLDGADKLEVELSSRAGSMLGWAGSACALRGGRIVEGARQARLDKLVGAEGLRVLGRGSAPAKQRSSFALSLAHVRFDRLSGEHRLESMETWLDVGKVLNPDALERLHVLACEMAQACLSLRAHPDHDCRAPESLRLHCLRTRDAKGPFGSRPLGAVMLPASAAAIQAALEDARAQAGAPPEGVA